MNEVGIMNHETGEWRTEDALTLVNCPRCAGTGWGERELCETCEGWGVLKKWTPPLLKRYAVEEAADMLSQAARRLEAADLLEQAADLLEQAARRL